MVLSAPADAPIQLTRGSPDAERAAELLVAPGALMQLTLEEARHVVDYMVPRFIPAETTFIKEGDTEDDGFLALVLDGEVVVESITVSRTVPLTLKVLGAGALVGEVGFLDKGARMASCTTSTVACFLLSAGRAR